MGKTREVKLVEQEVVTYICDLCGKEIVDIGNISSLEALKEIRQCVICDRYVCKECSSYKYLLDGLYCKECLEKGKDFVKSIEELKRRDTYKEIQKIHKVWRAKMMEETGGN